MRPRLAVFVALAWVLVGCTHNPPGKVAEPKPTTPPTPSLTAEAHWERAQTVAEQGKCGPAVLHAILATAKASARTRLPKKPALSKCLRRYNPPKRPAAKGRAKGLSWAAVLARRIHVPAGPIWTGRDVRVERLVPKGARDLLLWRSGPKRRLLPAFVVSGTEVTVAEWTQCVARGPCRTEKPGLPANPVTGVSFEEAQQYCAWLGGRLPTEAEWVRAARGAGFPPSLYPWGDTPAAGCAHVAHETGPSPVGTHPCDTSAFGLADMGGNVAEWVLSGSHGGGLVKGGSWRDPGWAALVSVSRLRAQGLGGDWIGFRCVWPEGKENAE